MKTENRKLNIASGFTLTELLVVISVMAVVIGLGVPAAKQIKDSFESSAGLCNVLSAALGNARAIALKNQKYAGLRFQQNLDGRQYLIFIIHDPSATGLANGFRAIQGLKPVKLPANVGLMDLSYVDRTYSGIGVLLTAEDFPINDDLINDVEEISETTTFSIVFSPSGKLTTHLVWIRNMEGRPDSIGGLDDDSDDKVFNKKQAVDDGKAMFYQDDYSGSPGLLPYGYLGFGPEHSRNNFVISATQIN